MDFYDVLRSRQSIRAYEAREVPESTLRDIFKAAQRAPSWCNIQPWRVTLLSGETRWRLRDAMVEATSASMPSPEVDFPPDYPEPYKSHRRECGKVLYEAMGIAREDREARHGAWMRNFASFDAPHVALVSVDTRLGFYVGVDIGAWLQSFLLAAQAAGVATCPQASVAIYPSAVRTVVSLPEHLKLLFGIAIGYPAADAPENQARTPRESIDERIVFCR